MTVPWTPSVTNQSRVQGGESLSWESDIVDTDNGPYHESWLGVPYNHSVNQNRFAQMTYTYFSG